MLNDTAAHWRAAASTAPVFLLTGAAIIFMTGLKSFKAGRAAYRLLAVGMLVFSVLLIQVAIWGLFDMWDTAWATSGSGLLPLALTAALIYVAARKFAKVLQIKSILNNAWFVVAITAVAGIAMGIFAHYFVKYHIDGTDLYIGTCSWGATYMTCASILMFKVAGAIGISYREAMRWLAISLSAFSISSWHEAINTLWFNNGSTYTDYGYYLIPWTVTGLVMLYASYRFRQMTIVSHSDAASSIAVTDDDYFDSITAIAGLASRPEAVDVILDDLREMTATLHPEENLSVSQRQRLMQIYRRLEKYLQEEDPLRSVSHEELLNRVTPPFRGLLEQEASKPKAF